MAESQKGIFLSYASQDAESAQRICEDLRAAGMQVWFDRSELRGGDAWDRQIRNQIHDCALFIPIISATTQGRSEGYFRREWKLAVDRTHDMSDRLAFLMPVAIDDTTDRQADVPDAFRRVQWTRLTGGKTTPAFVARISQLLSPHEPGSSTQALPSSAPETYSYHASGGVNPRRAKRVLLLIGLTLAILGTGSLGVYRFMLSRRPVTNSFAPPPHSLAVLPFVNMSNDKEQEYFSDGLTEELLNSLAEINGLQVAARTSAFSFKGKDVDIGTIARKLNVGAVLEGSVRRSEHTVRVTAQLINADTGFHLWSKTYDRDLGDILNLQTEIATAAADALKVTLLGNMSAKIELGGTRNPAAFDAYLRGVKLARLAAAATPMDCRAPADAFDEAVSLDSNYALSYAHRALLTEECRNNTRAWLQQPTEHAAREDAEHAIALAPDLADGYVAMSRIEQGALKFGAAHSACDRALVLSPSNDEVLHECSLLAAYLGHFDTAISSARRGVVLDPLNPLSHRALADALRYARRYQEAIAAYDASIAVDPEHAADAYALRGVTFYLTHDLASAQASCEASRRAFRGNVCLSMVYKNAGRPGEAAANLALVKKDGGDAAAYQYTEIYAQWGDREAALGWLEKAVKLGDRGLVYSKTDPLLDPLREETRFKAAERKLEFPN